MGTSPACVPVGAHVTGRSPVTVKPQHQDLLEQPPGGFAQVCVQPQAADSAARPDTGQMWECLHANPAHVRKPLHGGSHPRKGSCIRKSVQALR